MTEQERIEQFAGSNVLLQEKSSKIGSMTSALLSEADMERLTGKRQGAAQIRALRAMGIPHEIRPDGKPVVRADWDRTHRHEPQFGAIG